MSWRRALMSMVPEHRSVSALGLALARRGAIVFMLHRVLPPHTVTYDSELVTSNDLFEPFVGWLAAEFDIVSLGEISQRLADRKPLKRTCALTFDDGWLDNYTHAFPVLRKAKAPATIFLATGYIGSSRRLWQEKLWYLLNNRSEQDIQRFAKHWCDDARISVINKPECDFATWRAWLLNLGSDRAEDFVDTFEKTAGSSSIPGERTFMSWNEVKEMHGNGIEFGAHTVNHVFLPRAAREVVRAEIAESRNSIEREIATTVAGFAYPWGAVTNSIRDCVEKLGFRYAAGVQSGVVGPNSNRYLLPRVFVGTSVLRGGRGFSPAQTSLYVASRSVKHSDRLPNY